MLETFNLIIADSWRSFKKNLTQSPLLYVLFFAMAVFSVMMIAGISLVFFRLDILISTKQLFFAIFGIFLLKAAYDFYRSFITNHALVYALSTQKKQLIILSEIVLVIIWSNLGFWAVLSGFYTLLIFLLHLSFEGTIAYLFLTAAVLLSGIIGSLLCYLLFSKYRWFIPLLTSPLLFLWLSFNWVVLSFISIFYIVLFWVSLRNVLEGYLFQQQKNKIHNGETTKFPGSFWSVCVKEWIFLWRERLLASIVFSASFLGIITGYLAVFGQSLFLPEEIRFFTNRLSLETYAFVGIYVLVVYTAVFITLNLFLTEENKVWLIKSIPLSAESFVLGKLVAMILPAIASIPFLAFFLAFTQGESTGLIIWLFIFSFVSGVIIAAPLGSKYIGKKSDILLLYSVSLIMLLISSIGFSLAELARVLQAYSFIILAGTLFILLCLLFISVKISAFFLNQLKST
ncbi:MAG: hypothetical protein KGY65_01020 [Candidatus Thermoplasmatota archaeon]|nr:hypothetical protein [Candidatus Thermoplasmatota archaeon]MBS3801311.1 hypothetical protein [Candidatus Thermoplasmatota archaeon]